MKLNFQLDIDASVDEVWAAFDNPDNLTRWQQNLKSFGHTSGQPGQPGAVAELVYDENGHDVVMTETVTERREPDLLAGLYDNDWCTTTIVNHFNRIDGGRTRWSTWCNFKFKGFMKFAAFFFARPIRKRTEADMHRFRLMVETDRAGQS